MPLPKTNNVGKIIDKLKGDDKAMPRKQMIAIALHKAGTSDKKEKLNPKAMAMKLRAMKK